MERKSHISWSQVSRERKCQGWEDVSVGQVMVIQALEPAFSPQHPCKKKPDEALCLCTPSTEGSRLGQKDIQAGWAAKPASQWALGSVSKIMVESNWRTPDVNLCPPNTYTHIRIHIHTHMCAHEQVCTHSHTQEVGSQCDGEAMLLTYSELRKGTAVTFCGGQGISLVARQADAHVYALELAKQMQRY